MAVKKGTGGEQKEKKLMAEHGSQVYSQDGTENGDLCRWQGEGPKKKVLFVAGGGRVGRNTRNGGAGGGWGRARAKDNGKSEGVMGG